MYEFSSQKIHSVKKKAKICLYLLGVFVLITERPLFPRPYAHFFIIFLPYNTAFVAVGCIPRN